MQQEMDESHSVALLLYVHIVSVLQGKQLKGER